MTPPCPAKLRLTRHPRSAWEGTHISPRIGRVVCARKPRFHRIDQIGADIIGDETVRSDTINPVSVMPSGPKSAIE